MSLSQLEKMRLYLIGLRVRSPDLTSANELLLWEARGFVLGTLEEIIPSYDEENPLHRVDGYALITLTVRICDLANYEPWLTGTVTVNMP